MYINLLGHQPCYFLSIINTYILIKKKKKALSLSILTMSGPGKFPCVESN